MGFNILGYGNKTLANASTPIALISGQGYTIPSGQYQVFPGTFSSIQWFDPVTLTWKNLGTPSQSDSQTLSSDGTNYRIFNATGTMVGAVITTAGTGYTNGIYSPSQQLGTAVAPSVTMSAGGGTIVAKPTLVVGGAINTTVTFTGGSGYTVTPVLIVSPPPQGGVPATMTATITAGAISAVTVTNQGAGYLTAPTVTVVLATGDSTGTGGTVTVNATLVGSGTVTAITIQGNVPLPGSLNNPSQNGVFPTTSYIGGTGGAGMTTVPTFTFAPASTTAATAIMCFTATTVTFAGPSNAGNGNFGLIGSTITAGSATLTNPAISTGLFTPRVGSTAFSTSATPTTTVINDGGLHQTIPNAVLVLNSNGTISAATTTTIVAGGVTDISYTAQI